METICFQTTVGDDHVIRVPQGIAVPCGPVEVTIAPCPVDDTEPIQGVTLREKLLAWAAKMEKLQPDLPTDLAANHDFYAHGKPRE